MVAAHALRDIRPLDVKRYASEVAAKGLAPNSVRLALAPVKALFATAVEEGSLTRTRPPGCGSGRRRRSRKLTRTASA